MTISSTNPPPTLGAGERHTPTLEWSRGHREGWRIDGPEHAYSYYTVVQKGRKAPVAFVTSLRRDKDGEALTNLITAAPDLLAALQACLALIRNEYSDAEASALQGHPIHKDAREEWDAGWAAISKALTPQASEDREEGVGS